ncbi:hypothetical protein Y032_0446g1603 [Ancylostoma ceylanicum]|uniref:Uncharacterized protein n=1 Tax=Ancylostoma ceylanicum TaxID=53326 RepID=A0A016X0V2_9BILA|nr:hypothetical protein Y032_0446g1603 [Ancylostoma ceylanicum]
MAKNTKINRKDVCIAVTNELAPDMFYIILLCTVLGPILAHPLSGDYDGAIDLVNMPDHIVTDQMIGAWTAMMKTIRDTSLTKEKRVEKIVQLPLQEGNGSVSPESAEHMVELIDYHWKLLNNASPKVKAVWSKSYDLKSDPEFYKMDLDKRKAEGEKLYNSLSETDKKEMKEIAEKMEEKHKELRRKEKRTHREVHTHRSK